MSNEQNCSDPVNHPAHYQSKSGLETIDVIEAFTEDLTGLEAVCTANALKYLCRWKHKNGVQDLRKAKWYIDKLIDTLGKKSDKIIKNITKGCHEPIEPLSKKAEEKWTPEEKEHVDNMINKFGSLNDTIEERTE